MNERNQELSAPITNVANPTDKTLAIPAYLNRNKQGQVKQAVQTTEDVPAEALKAS